MLDAYIRALSGRPGQERSWSYAEQVARTATLICGRTSDPEVYALAVRACLISAVDKDRYNALGSLDALLTRVAEDEVAVAVSEALRNEIRRYREVAKRVDAGHLHPTLRAARRDAIAGV